MRAGEVGGNRVQVRFGLTRGHARLQAPERPNVVRGPAIQPGLVAGLNLRLQRHWNPELGRQENLGSEETFGSDADDIVVQAVQLGALAHDVRIASKTVLPGCVAEHDHGVG